MVFKSKQLNQIKFNFLLKNIYFKTPFIGWSAVIVNSNVYLKHYVICTYIVNIDIVINTSISLKKEQSLLDIALLKSDSH